ncbi:uncharacterized protein LOC143429163 [Xylocopa sonorina]|uniref:uncharacterized protein LOC143429163 n=1 Tax=Xylocopa sonorina TaxID=1818115 RepID=UPI00403AF5B3
MIVDDIMMLKEKHIKITDSQINELLQDQIKSIHSVKNKQNQHCNEDELKVKSLMSKVTLLKESLQSENQTLECKNQDLSKHLDCIVELEAKKKKLLQDNHTLELQRNKLKTCKRNLQDQELLDQGRRKFLLYKELTRIRWDYAKLKESITGCILM